MRKCLANNRGEVKLIFVFLITLAVLTVAVVGVTYLAYRNAEKGRSIKMFNNFFSAGN